MNGGYDYRAIVRAGSRPVTLLEYLVERYRHSTQAEWRERILDGSVLVDERRARPRALLRNGQLLVWRRPPWQEPAAPVAHHVIHDDPAVLAVSKPAGLPVLPGAGFLENTLWWRVREHYPEAVPVHRLGRWTSGLVIFARRREARDRLARAWRSRRVGKRYRALATGVPTRREFAVNTPIGPVPHRRLGTIHAACPEGKPAHSRVEVVELQPAVFLADVSITTGRPHQIRIHMAAAGFPLVGDPLYPRGGRPESGSDALPGDPGYSLHASGLVLEHPATGGELRLECPPPPELRARGELPGHNGG